MNFGHGYANRPKYGNKKAKVNGEVLDSGKEGKRYKELLLLERAGLIADLKRQVKYVLIPAQRAPSRETYSKGPRKGTHKPGKLLEKECCYVADFVYTEVNSNRIVVEDVKGYKTPEYIIKRKLMLYNYGIRIKET